MLLLQDKSFEYKQLILKQSLVNLKIFIRKFLKTNHEFNLVRFISIKRVVYIERHLDVDSKLKSALLETLVDYFKAKQATSLNKFDSIYLNRLVASIMDELELKVNESFSENLLKLVSFGLIDLNELDSDETSKLELAKNTSARLGQLLFKHLSAISSEEASKSRAITLNCTSLSESLYLSSKYYEQFNVLVRFLANLLKESLSLLKPNGFEFDFVVNLLNSSDYYILSKFNHVLFQVEARNSENNEIIAELNDSIFVFLQLLYSSLAHKVKLSLNGKLFKSNKPEQELRTNLIYEFVADSSENSLNLSRYAFEEAMANNGDFVKLVEQMCLVESEAFLRREQIKFLCIYHSYAFKNMLLFLNTSISCSFLTRSNVGSFNLRLWNSLNFVSYFLINDFDWQIQVYCLEFFRDVFALINLLLEKLGRLHNEIELNATETRAKHTVSSELIVEFSKFSVVEIIFCFSDSLKSLIGCIGDYDQHVVDLGVRILLELKSSKKVMALIEECDAKHNNVFQEVVKSTYLSDMKMSLSEQSKKVVVGAEYSSCVMNSSGDEDLGDIEEENCLKKFLNSITVEYLSAKMDEAKQSSDLYSSNPMAILDDIISSYQFEIDEEKAVDCY